MKKTPGTHTPVMLQQVMDGLQIRPESWYVDATAGQGGYITEILRRGGCVCGVDSDKNQIDELTSHFQLPDTKLKLIHGNFSDLSSVVPQDIQPVAGVVFDLGLSYKQLSHGNRGFSFKKPDEPLDMRIDVSQELTAGEVLNRASFEELEYMFQKNSEEIHATQLAREICHKRHETKFEKISDLLSTIQEVCGQGTRCVSRVFQALRMEVNNELEVLRKGLQEAVSILEPSGRLVVVTFHLVEDRVVKQVAHEKLPLKNISKTRGKSGKTFEQSAVVRVYEKTL